MPEAATSPNQNYADTFDQIQLECYDLLLKVQEKKRSPQILAVRSQVIELEMCRSRLFVIVEKINNLRSLIKTPYFDSKNLNKIIADFLKVIEEIKQIVT